jgi:hypothetical protein
MNPFTGNTLLKEKSIFELKNSIVKEKAKLIITVYTVWLVFSIILAVLHSHKFASCFTDLPDNMKNIPPFVLSIVYLDLFIPAITVIIILLIAFLFNVIKNISLKQ